MEKTWLGQLQPVARELECSDAEKRHWWGLLYVPNAAVLIRTMHLYPWNVAEVTESGGVFLHIPLKRPIILYPGWFVSEPDILLMLKAISQSLILVGCCETLFLVLWIDVASSRRETIDCNLLASMHPVDDVDKLKESLQQLSLL